MYLTFDPIVAEARQSPRGQTAEPFGRLLADTIDAPDAGIELASKTETRRRIVSTMHRAEIAFCVGICDQSTAESASA